MTDSVAWTEEGRAELAKEHTWGMTLLREIDRPTLRARLDASLARFAPCWERGLAKSDADGEAAVAHARQWASGAPPASVSVDDAAGLLSLLGARSGDHDAPLIELLLRDRGLAFLVAVLVRMWSMVTDYDDPDWPTSEDRLAIWLRGVDATTSASSLCDCSVSHAKGNLADYLGKVHHTGTDAERAELERAVAEAWTTAPLHARPALAVAARSTARAEEVVTEIFAAGVSWYPHYARNELPLLVTDPALLDRLGFTKDGRLTLRFLEHRGTAALPLYAARLGGRGSAHVRAALCAQLVNLRGPQTAALLAPFAEKAPMAATIRAYFARYPELLAIVRADPALAKHGAQLDKLAAKLAAKTSTKKPPTKKQPTG